MTIGELADATIVFDLDGTLVDSAPDLVRALNATLDLEGLPHTKLENVRRMVGRGARAMIERAAEFHGVTFGPERLDQLWAAFIEIYRADIATDSRPYPGILEALGQLANMGAKLSVCTNKRTELSNQLLDALDLSKWFSAVIGADAVTDKKPHPEHYRAAVERAGGTVRRSVMIGDTSIDVGAARAAGAPVIIVSFGYCDADADKLGADVVLDRYSELTPACRRLLAARP
ncbi:phosphoglycolate phosphatase [Vitreimonas flagellata]|uniref:phosphoglycolate phosphatase n=1 Tax=Vitreimonas flagellata TaxID=2560861 RepID=UPI001074CA1F|nr:phosphoglycolate phosphatase [Vitreimonas flagellata]